MGFLDAKRRLIDALERGDFAHEPRAVQDEKNLLAVGDVSAEFVIHLVRRARGQDYVSSPHHADATVEVHRFLAYESGDRWYVKAYFSPHDSAVFISVHRA